MKVRLANRIPRAFPKRTPGMVAQKSLRVYGTTLRAMVVVFEEPKHLRAFWVKHIGGNLGRRCWGAVNGLAHHVQTVEDDGSFRDTGVVYDRRHFCIIGLVRSKLGMRILSHECVHAGFSHARRVKRTPWAAEALRFDEEAVAYPAGEVARSLVEWLRREDLA